jgi:hypothetical protein
MGMTPVDMGAVDDMGADTAAQSEEGARKLGDAAHGLMEAAESRTERFGAGASEARQAVGIATAVKALP